MLIRFVICCFALLCFCSYAANRPAQVAIIIDDIGFQKADPLLIKLPYALTFAVMPFTPNGVEMAKLATQYRKEVMLHMPMEAVAQNHLLGKGALRQGMSKSQVQQALHLAIAQVPQAVGVNNHMGSLYTSLAEPMDWTMQVMAERGLYFIDSKTTGRSQVEKYTQLHGVKSRSRDIFLDNDKSYKAIDKQFNQLIAVAKQHGSAIAIGHPYPETYQYLRKNLARLQKAGIQLVPASQLLDRPNPPASVLQALASHKQAPESHQSKVKAAEKPKVLAETHAAKSTPTQQAESQVASVTLNASEKPQAITQLTPETEVQPIELLPWRLPYRIDAAGFSAPSQHILTPPHGMAELFLDNTLEPDHALPKIGVLNY